MGALCSYIPAFCNMSANICGDSSPLVFDANLAVRSQNIVAAAIFVLTHVDLCVFLRTFLYSLRPEQRWFCVCHCALVADSCL
jgi:hypothetical protein